MNNVIMFLRQMNKIQSVDNCLDGMVCNIDTDTKVVFYDTGSIAVVIFADRQWKFKHFTTCTSCINYLRKIL